MQTSKYEFCSCFCWNKKVPKGCDSKESDVAAGLFSRNRDSEEESGNLPKPAFSVDQFNC